MRGLVVLLACLLAVPLAIAESWSPSDLAFTANTLPLTAANERARELDLRLADDLLAVGGADAADKVLRAASTAVASRRLQYDVNGATSASVDAGLDTLDGNIATARNVLALAALSDPFARVMSVADEGVRSRGALSGMEPAYVDNQRANLELATALRGASGPVARVSVATQAQATLLGTTLLPVTPPTHTSASAAVAALAARHGATLDASDAAALDALPPGVEGALADVVDAFVALEDETATAFAAADPAALDALWYDASVPDFDDPAWETPEALWDPLGAAGVELGGVFEARIRLVEAVAALQEAAALYVPSPVAPCDAVEVLAPPETNRSFGIVAIDVTACPNTWATDYALIVDFAGGDTYLNNAGGSRLGTGCTDPREPVAAALVDLSGNDVRRGGACGVNGGAAGGVGFLYDGGGDDIYDITDPGRASGANGGGHVGAGFLLDVAGHDLYAGPEYGTNGGGFVGVGMLLDLGSGEDDYVSKFGGVNGGAEKGVGFLFDDGGRDVYDADARVSNGGALLGAGFLVDLAGDDTYDATSPTMIPVGYRRATNGGGSYGTGFILDAGGDDTYTAESEGTNGGGWGGVGMLVDVAGQDNYTAGDNGTNGAGWGLAWTSSRIQPFDTGVKAGLGVLVDGSGDDGYEAGNFSVNGGAYLGASFLADLSGNDWYFADDGGGVNGGSGGHSHGGAVAFLLDVSGNDQYVVRWMPDLAGGKGANGGAGGLGGVGFLFDVSGRDSYRAHHVGVNGGAWLGVGMLLDAQGNDEYLGGHQGVNGGAFSGDALGERGNFYPPGPAAGFLLDGLGDDTYTGSTKGVNGGGYVAAGALFDGGGKDRYTAGNDAGNGGGAGGIGLLADRAGKDEYRAALRGANGGAWSGSRCEAGTCGEVPIGVGLLKDGGGALDSYTDAQGGTGVDHTRLRKGNIGSQIDVPG